MILAFCACGNTVEVRDAEQSIESIAESKDTVSESDTTDTGAVSDIETEAATTAAPEPEFVNVENIGEYVVIRSKGSTVSVRNAATDLCADIYVETEILLSVNTDKMEESEYEILIGKTNRVAEGIDYDALGIGEYIIKKTGNKIVIAGGSERALKNAINYFSVNFIAEGAVRLPLSGEYIFAPKGYLDSITIDGTPITEYTIIEDLYDDSIAEKFAADIENAIYSELPIKSAGGIDDYGEKYILLSDTNTDFTSHYVKVENGNIILSGNYTTIDECIDYFFGGMLGYNVETGNVSGETHIKLTSGMGETFTEEKKEVYSKDKLMQVLTDVYNSDKIIVGQHMSAYRYGETLTTERSLYMENLGVDCPLFGFDVAEAQSGTKYTWNAQVKDAYDMVEYAREGGIFTFSVHFDNPSGKPEGLAYYRGELGNGTAQDWEKLLTKGTEYNENFMESLSDVGDFLEIFHNNGVPVIFRPLHEMNGNWFWFCIVNGEENNTIPKEYAVRLWVMIYDYLVTERGIDSMIWEYSPNVAEKTTSSKVDVMYCYPGDEYCEIVGCDWYTSSYTGHEVLRISEDALSQTGKIFSVTEFGPGGDIRTDYNVIKKDMFTCLHLDDLITEVTEAGIKTCYWLLWSSWSEVRISMWNMGDGRAFYGNDVYLTLKDTYKLLYE
ncbi:MAG: hypothetical protein IJZ89_07125 [Clostridia bacterium]|nr:hypothetical protein [Clostridia bacterium]